MELSSHTSEGMRIITVPDARIDAAVAIEFKDAMRGMIEDAPERLVLDLGHVNFIDSSGLGAIVASMKMLNGERSLALAAMTPTVAKVFKLTRMDTVFDIYETVDLAKFDVAS
ncbi:MAG: STAS domain-containing protein [Pseudomonadota bacterium]